MEANRRFRGFGGLLPFLHAFFVVTCRPYPLVTRRRQRLKWVAFQIQGLIQFQLLIDY